MSTSTIPLFGRAWKLSVKVAGQDGPGTEVLSTSNWDPTALRVTFEVLESSYLSPFWFADVKVYNQNTPEQKNLLWNAAWLTLEAGYQTGTGLYATIWDGPVLQVIFDRENVVDLTMRFNCLGTIPLLANNFVNLAFGEQSSQYSVVENFMDKVGANANQQVGPKAKQLLQAKLYPRGKTVFGDIRKFMGGLADDNSVSHWNSSGLPIISEVYDASNPNPVSVIYSPPFPPGQAPANPDSSITRSIIGVPRQTPVGVIFTVLLDPRLKVKVPPMLAKLDYSIISQAKVVPPNLVYPLDPSGVYVVGQVHHYGDTRGNDWYTEVTGYRQDWAQGLLKQLFSAVSPGAAP